MRLDDPKAVIHRCGWEDLAVVTLQPNALGPMLEFFDIAASWVDPPLDELVCGVGYPVSYGVRMEEGRVGPITHKAILLSPTPFNGNVLPPPVGDELKFKFGGFNPDRHYLIPFEHAKEGKRPEGISGAAVWCQSAENHIVWTPRFKFAGVCTSCYKDGTVEQIVRASTVQQFLLEVFGAPEKKLQ
ncbi:MAG TPA: hypothetical protein VNX26_02290 [Candidatus Acidoferrum sp.]|nr:hypothetical protein [Candidatus Acidoferrum sp.]